jgi:hypothetical protein
MAVFEDDDKYGYGNCDCVGDGYHSGDDGNGDNYMYSQRIKKMGRQFVARTLDAFLYQKHTCTRNWMAQKPMSVSQEH